MQNKKKIRKLQLEEKNKFIAISVFSLLVFSLLVLFFPYTGDDWAWGSQIGTERLNSFFVNYNGRYLGNLLVMALTRSKLLNVVVLSLSYYVACYLCYRYTEKKINLILIFSLVLFFVMPRGMFMQSVVWTSGYSNYVPSALISLLYLIMIKNIADRETPEYGKFSFIPTFLMGFCGALFMENITLFNVCLGFAVIGYCLIKFRRIFSCHIGFLIGAVIGAVCMFSNGAYFKIANGTDGYRSTASGLSGIVDTLKSHIITSIDNLLFSNCIMCIIATVVLSALVFKYLKNSNDKAPKTVSVIALTLNYVSLAVIIMENVSSLNGLTGMFSSLQTKRVQFLTAVIYVLSIFLISFLCIDKQKRFKTMLPLYCVPVVVAPLLLVNPIGPRCFFVAYLFMMAYISDALAYAVKDCKLNSLTVKSLVYLSCVTLVFQVIIYLNIFYPVYTCNEKRNEFAKLQSDNGNKTVYICELPNKSYLWTSSPTNEPWITRYKLFYGLDEEAQFTFVSEDELDKIIKEYNKVK